MGRPLGFSGLSRRWASAARQTREGEDEKRSLLCFRFLSSFRRGSMTRYWISSLLSLCREERFSSSPSSVSLACSPSRKSWGSTSNLSSHCSPTVIRPKSDPLSWPLFQISARHFFLQVKETNAAAMASTLRMRAPIYPVVAWRRWTAYSQVHFFKPDT